jgi:hypothetical protein
MLQQLQATSANTPVPARANECRVYERHECELATSCKPAAANEMKWTATIRNLSRNGVKCNLSRRFERGAGLAIELPEKNGQESYVVFVKVIYALPESDGTWSLGCKFISELSEEELQRLLLLSTNTQPSAPPEKQLFTEVRLQIDLPQGNSVQRRVKRLRIASSWPYPAGKKISLRLAALDGTAALHDFEVVACREHQGERLLQVRLLEPTGASKLMHVLRR